MDHQTPQSSSTRSQPQTAGEASERIRRLQDTVSVCPTDSQARYELAIALEATGRIEEALLHWKAILTTDPNNLKAWEGLTGCRKQLRPPEK